MAVPKLPFKFDLGVIDGVSGPLKRISDKVGSSVFGQGFKRFGGGVGSVLGVVTKTTAAVTGLVTAAGGGMFALARSTAKAGDEIGKLSSRINVSAQFLQEWQYISERQGVGIEQFNDGIQDFAKNLGELRLKQGSLLGILQGTAPAMVAWLGDGDRGVEASFEGFIDKLRNVEDATTQAAIANAAFGGAGKMMLGLLRTDAAGLEQLRQEAHKYGRMLSTETVDNSESFLDMLTNLEGSLGKVKDAFGSELMPVFERYGRQLTEWIAGNGPKIEKWAETTAEFVGTVAEKFRDLVGWVDQTVGAFDRLTDLDGTLAKKVGGRDGFKWYDPVDLGRLATEYTMGPAPAGTPAWISGYTSAGGAGAGAVNVNLRLEDRTGASRWAGIEVTSQGVDLGEVSTGVNNGGPR